MRTFIIYTIMVAIICISLIGTINYRREDFSKLDKKIHTFKRIYGFMSFIFDFINNIHHFNLNNTKENLRNISIEKTDYQKAYIYVISKLTISFVAFLIILLMGYFKCANDTFNKNTSIKILTRPNYGEGDKEYRFSAVFNNGYSEDIKITVPEKKYTEKEAIDIFNKYYNSIVKELLGKNSSEDNITDNLNFISGYKNIVNIQWYVNEDEYIDYTGNVKWNNINDSVETSVEMILSIGEFSKSYIIVLTINNEGRAYSSRLSDNINEFINAYSEYDSEIILPKEIDSKPVRFQRKKYKGTLMYFVLAFITAIIMFIAKNKELQKVIKKRNEQLETDYVFIISKITILHSAGMTVLAAWDKIIEDYNKVSGSTKFRYAYEEMKIARQKIKNGTSETSAYVEFGKRCGLHSYIKLGNLLEQNVRKGTKGLKEMLNQEVAEAYAERKVQARKKGDEAGTKLLFPMGIMLIISMLMVIIPAFMSMNI